MVKMKEKKIYKLLCVVSRVDRLFTFVYIQPAPDIRIAYRLMRERLRDYYGFKFVRFLQWTRVDIEDYYHYKIN